MVASRHALAVLLVAMLGCSSDPAEPVDEGPPQYGPPIAAPVDKAITVLPVASEASETLPWIEPVAVGVEFDGLLRADGSLDGYQVDDAISDPLIYLHFASDAWFAGNEEDSAGPQTCYAWGWWTPTINQPLDSSDGAAFFASYQGAFDLIGHDCGALLDPEVHGTDGADFMAAFDGMPLGLGFGLLTDALEESWPPSTLQTWGPSMLSSYVALGGSAGSLLAQDLSTTFAIALQADGESLATDAIGEPVILDVSAAMPDEDSLPDLYAYTVATFYLPLDAVLATQ
ncbi:MAG: hypothetical protein ACI9WU_001683 [Myxococcota bacterium]|jgi:hypothetical protein